MWGWNIRNWIKQYVPPFLRGDIHLSWIYALLKPVESLYSDLLSFRSDILDKISYNGQTIVLETLLNRRFDNLNRIRIITESDLMPVNYIYTAGENQPLFIKTLLEGGSTLIFTVGEYMVGFEFVVIVPVGLLTTAEEIRLKSTVNFYRIAGKRPLFKYTNGITF